MSSIATQRPRRHIPLDDDERLYEIVNGVKVYPRDEEADHDVVDGVRDEALYEVVRGVRQECPPMALKSSAVNSELARHLGNHAKAAGIGRVVVEGLFLIDSIADTKRRPDIAFVSFDRWPKADRSPEGTGQSMPPDLAVEIVSPTDRAEAALTKIREYFDSGVRLVWAVYPELRVIHVFESFTSIRVVAPDGELVGDEVVPGFRLPMATLFEDLEG